MKYYLAFSVFVLMLITSLGIFGFLSKANIEQTLQGDSYSLEMSIIDKRLDAKNNELQRLEDRIANLDNIIATARPQDRNYIDRRQRDERQEIGNDIDIVVDDIVKLNEEKLPFQRLQLDKKGRLEANQVRCRNDIRTRRAQNYLDNAVRWVIIALIFVFDPLALLLLITATSLIANYNGQNNQESLFECRKKPK